jgi:hypothetical protein
VHQAADGEVGHHEAIKLLTHQIGGFAAQHDVGTAQMGLEFVERGLSGKGLARYLDFDPFPAPPHKNRA